MKRDSRYPTIRQAAAQGPLSEHYLRLLLKQHKLPGFYCGRHYRVNYTQLLNQLEELSRISNDESDRQN